MSPEAIARLRAILTDLHARAQTPTAKGRTGDRARACKSVRMALICNLVAAEGTKAGAAVRAPEAG